MDVARASVLICTYNRARLLRETLAALQTTSPARDCETEIIVVDNNSSDNTAVVVAEAARRGPFGITYLREARQGKSFALNAGLAQAHGDVVALTDDDVLPASDWLIRIVDAFRRRDVAFVFGKVLPRWSRVPPPQLLSVQARDVWGPLAIVDYGDEPTAYNPDEICQRLPIGANLAFARSALVTIGGWRTDLGKVNNTLISGEDHEIFIRLRRFGLYSGYYDPEMTVRHYVPAERLTRRYFRQWFFWHGKTEALMLDDLFPDVDMSRVPRVLGVPRFLYRQAAGQLWKWIRRIGRRDELALLIEELRLLDYAGMFTECWRRRFRTGFRPKPIAVAAGGPISYSSPRLNDSTR
jgi:glucosyl-dolichyl phosphate glucuronosyltransferase